MRLYLSVILLALIVSGCAESDILSHQEEEQHMAELSISPQYQAGQIHFKQPSMLRADAADYLPDGSEIGVFVHSLSSNRCVANLRWRAFGDASAQQWRNIGKDGSVEKYYLSGTYSRLFSYYPFTENSDELITEHSNTDLNGYLPALRIRPGYTDYLIGNGESLVNSSNPQTGVSKNHLLSYLNFRVEKKPGYTGSGIVSELIVKNQFADSWISLSSGRNIPDSYLQVSKSDLHVNTDNQSSIYVLAIPHSSEELTDSYFRITIDGKVHNVAIPDNTANGYKWEQGKRYTYRFCLNPVGNITAELADFEFGGDWDATFTNPKILENSSGNVNEISRPTPYWDDNVQSRKFEIARQDLNNKMSWYEGASWIRQGGSINNLTPGATGCHTYRENGDNWRIPVYHELQLIYNKQKAGELTDKDIQPLAGVYWSGNWIQNKNRATYWNLTSGESGNASPDSRYKIRCVRDIVN